MEECQIYNVELKKKQVAEGYKQDNTIYKRLKPYKVTLHTVHRYMIYNKNIKTCRK